ncbi:MAG: homoserine dehydrogenase [Myxococcales bacterium]
MRDIRVGLIGCGVVGQGVMRLLTENASSIEGRLGAKVSVRRIAVRNLQRDRGEFVDPALLTDDVDAVLDDPEIEIVVEVMGGIETAGEHVRRALEAGKSVVTANKALIADRGHALIELAESRGQDLYFEAAVAGGIPVLRVLREALASDRVVALRGIINGTSNYVLSQMQNEGSDFGDALQQAQAAGYAEADPTLDVDGGDAAHKLNILATLAFGARLPADAVTTEGIDVVSAEDIEFARRFGYVIKPLAIARADQFGEHGADHVQLRVHPALVSRDDTLAHISGALNAVDIEGAALGPCLLSGPGAGSLPTAVSVVADVVDVGRNLLSNAGGRVPQRAFTGERVRDVQVQDIADHRCRMYLRFSVRDQSGVLGQLTTVLGAHRVSIEQMIQTGQGDGAADPVSVVLLTHPAREGDVRAALSEIDDLGILLEPTTAIRIEE